MRCQPAVLALSAAVPLFLLNACGGGGDLTSGRPSVAQVTISPPSARVEAGTRVQFSATLTDPEGQLLTDRQISWSSSTPSVAAITGEGLATAIATGTTTIKAISEGQQATAPITVARIPLATVEVSPATAELPVGSVLQLSAVLTGEGGEILSNRTVSWTSSTPAVAPISALGVATGTSSGTTTVTATSEGKSGTATITVPPLGPVATVTVFPAALLLENNGPAETSSLLVAQVHDASGNLLAGHTLQWESSDEEVVTVSPTGLVVGKLYGQARISASTEGHSGSSKVTVSLLFGTPVPVPVGGSHQFATLSASGFNTCGLDRTGALHCWGVGPNHSINFGAGGPGFSALAAGGSLDGNHMCALTAAGQAYCWGENSYGQLGNGSETYSDTPQPVAGNLTFAYLSTGQTHTCGLTTTGAAYCWGLNFAGELGTGGPANDDAPSLVPVAVAGGLTFKTIGTGDDQTCGLTTEGKGYCWGENDNGELGDGTRVNRLTPVAVAGGHTFRALAVGGEHTCGLTLTGAVYCWGWNNQGGFSVGLGDRPNPTLVSGNLTFSSLAAGGAHDCAITSAGAAHCWGTGFFGQLGDRSGTDRTSPSAVYGGFAFTSVTLGSQHSCGLESSGAAYCWGHDENGELGTGLR